MTQFPGPWSLVVEKPVVEMERVSEDFSPSVCKPRINAVRQEFGGQIQHISTRIDSLITQPSRQ